jgi:predicted small secreted protein
MSKVCAKFFLAIFLFSTAGTLLSACNTTEGAGKDISAAGHKISNEAKEHE